MANRINSVKKTTTNYQAPVIKDGKLSYSLYDSEGEKVGNTLVEPGTDMSNARNMYFTKGDDGLYTMSDKPSASVSLNEDTGNISIEAPKGFLDSTYYKEQVKPTLELYSQAYKSNQNYKFSITGEDGTTKEKSIQDIINDLNAPLQNDDGSYNPNSIQYMASAAIGMERTKQGHKAANGVELDDNDAIRINTIAIGPDVKDNTLQLISDLPEAQFLRNISTYDPNTGMAQRKDILDNAWNKEKVSSEDMEKLIAALENYFAKGDFSDKEAYIKNTATMRFLTSQQPEMSWIRDVTENVRSLIDGVLGFATNVGTSAYVASDYAGLLIQGLGPDQWAEYQDIYGEDFGETYVRRAGVEVDTGKPWEKVDGKIGRVSFDENGVPVYKEERIEGAFEDPKTHAQYVRTVFKENQATIKKDLEYLHASQAGWDTAGYVIANIATLISAGNALSNAFVSAGRSLVSDLSASAALSLEDLSSFATTMYSPGTALAFWDTADGAAALVNGMGTIYDIATITGQAAEWVNVLGEVFSSTTALTPILGVVGESLGEAIVGDPDRFVEFLKSTEITDDTKNYLIETYVGNALGWGVGLGAGKFLLKMGETTRGRAISANLRKHLFKIQNGVGDATDQLILKLRRVKGDNIAEQIESLRNKGGRAAKQANSLASAQLLREARKVITESDSIKIFGKETEEIQEALSEIDAKVVELEKMENALTSMQRRGMDIAAAWLKDEGSSLKITTQNFYKAAGNVADLEKKAGKAFAKVSGAVTDMTSGKTIRLFSQTTTNYIKATEKLDYINSYLAYYENAPDVTDAILKNIEAYKKEAVELQGMIDTFINAATPQLKAAADQFIEADRKWWSSFEDLRSDLGLTDANELDWYRASGLWGDNGSLYAQTGRKADLSEYVIKHRNGDANVKTFDNYEQYMAGATGDFADPMAQMQVALYDSANKQASRSFAKSFDALTGSLTTKVSGEETAMATRMKKGLQKAYEDGSKRFLSGITESVKQDSVVNDVIKNLKTKVDTKIGQNKAQKAMRTSAKKMEKKLVAVDGSSAGRYISRLDPQSTDNLWNEFYSVTPRQLMADGEQFIPTKTKRYIYAKARDLGVDVDNNISFLRDDFVSPYDATSLSSRRALEGAETQLKRMDKLAEDYKNGINWGKQEIPEEYKGNDRLEELRNSHIRAGERAAKDLGFSGSPEDFDDWFAKEKDAILQKRADLQDIVNQMRGSQRPALTFNGVVYDDKDVPSKYIKTRAERQRISDSKLGVWNSPNGGLASDWLSEGTLSSKKPLRDAIEGDQDLRAALLSTMYDNSGSKLPYEEWLNTPMTLRRQQEVDSLRKEDAFLSFSMNKDWQGIGGLTPRLPTESGDIVTIQVKPKDTLGEIPKGVDAEDELEILVPREVYATAMSDFYSNGDDNLAKTYDAVNRALTGAATPDPSFENTIKRSIMSQNDMITTNKTVQNTLTEMNQARYTAKYDTFLRDLNEQYEELGRQYDIAVEYLQVAGGEQTEAYIEAMTREGSLQRSAIDEMCRYYGLEGDQNAVRYFALSAFVDNEAKYKKELFDQLKKMIDESNPKLKFEKAGKNKTQSEKAASILTDGIARTMEEEFNDMYLIVKEMNPDAVHDATGKFAKEIDDAIEEIEGSKRKKAMDEVNRVAKKIEDVKGNQYAGDKNIVAFRNSAGQVEYYETDKLLAGLLNFQTSAQQVSGFGQAIYNANYLWTKLFRLGTTAINIKSMISQTFRDPINMYIGGGAYRTSQRVADNLTDVFGDDIVNYLKMYEPDALKTLQATAEETGEDVARLAVQRELNIGKALSPAATETSMYRSLRNARTARLNGLEDVYDVTPMDRVTNAIDKVADKGGKLNEIREKTLRNVAYANGLEIAMKRGYSLDQARAYATFIMNESTTNFSRLTNHLLALRDTVPYLGSAINGSKSFWRLLSIDPVGVIGRLTGGIIIPQVALVAYSLQDERNREIYKNIPEYQKEDNLIFVMEGQVFSIPIPQELGSFIAPFRQMVESMHGVSTNNFIELAANDILGFSPIELSGFADLDYSKIETSSPGFMDRVSKGMTKMWAQLAPAPFKSAVELITGIDPYTGRKIDTSYTDIDENGNFIVKDYKSGLFAKALNDMFKSWGWSTSAPVVQNVLGNILGDASVDVADFLVSLCSAVPNGGIDWSTDTNALRANEAYNPFYTLTQRASAPIEVEVYDEAQSAWKTAVSQLYDMKEQILESDEWKNYRKAKSQETDPEKLQKLNSTKKNLVEDYFNRVKTVVENLQNNYGAQFTPAKYASVLSLMTMDEQTLDAGSYGDYLNSEDYKTARAQAIQTMVELGFPSASGQDILGKYQTDKNGNIKVETYHPLALLQLDDTKGAALRTQSNKQHFAVIRNLVSEAGLYDQRSNYQSRIKEARNNKDWNKAEDLINEYNEKVIRAVGSYIQQYTPESVLAGDALDYLKEYIMVPSEFQTTKYGKRATSLGNGAYLSEAFKEPYLKYIFNYGDNKL